MKAYQNLMAALTVDILLIVPFLPGALAYCDNIKPNLKITTPKYIKALIGSCLQVPCTYDTDERNYESSRTIHGVWMKTGSCIGSHRGVVIFNSSGSVNTFSLNITGNLEEKNCTTLFPDLNTSLTDKYFFRIENGPFKATACADPLQIIVKDSPWSPSINIPVGDLKEHQSVTITCSALTPCPRSPPELNWNLQQDSHRQTEKNTDGTFTTKIQETITLSETHDGYNISCSARYSVKGGSKTAETGMTLSVSYAPKDTSASISPSGLVSAGSWVELSCSGRAKPPPSFTWFRNSKHGAINVSVQQVYSFNATEGGEYYCFATNDLGDKKSSLIKLNIKDLAKGSHFLITTVVGVTLFICLVGFAWYFKSKRHIPQQTQIETYEEAAVQASETEKELHYGKITFLPRQPEASSVSVQDSGQQETVYSQVKVSADSPEDLYAQVKKT